MNEKTFRNGFYVTTLEEAVVDSDVLLCCSVAGAFSEKMLQSMAKHPIIFAMANPEPEIATSVRADVIIDTGRNDYPNQINNVIGFPNIFRGALDSRAKKITTSMKIAASKAIVNIAKNSSEHDVQHIIPSQFNTTLLENVAFVIAEKALNEGIKLNKNFNLDVYISHIFANYKYALLDANGKDEGIEDGNMRYSEVGHTTIGAGKIIKQHSMMLDELLSSNNIETHNTFRTLIKNHQNNGVCHIVGILSNIGVHGKMIHALKIAR